MLSGSRTAGMVARLCPGGQHLRCASGMAARPPAFALGYVLEVSASGVRVLSGSRTAGLAAGLCPGGRCLYGVR
eukprot:8613941-Pyramimonas_sp.AAC.1